MSQWVRNWDFASVSGSIRSSGESGRQSKQALSNRGGPPSSVIAAVTERGAKG